MSVLKYDTRTKRTRIERDLPNSQKQWIQQQKKTIDNLNAQITSKNNDNKTPKTLKHM
jgi:hypothetical protein